MDVSTLKQTIETYETQLKQVDQALEISGQDNSELVELRENLLEVISLSNESLLSLSKAAALQQIEGVGSSSQEEDEYAAFQAALGDDLTHAQPVAAFDSSTANTSTANTSTANSSAEDDETVLSSNLDDIIGTCVRAPHSHSWGGYQYHNAAIIGLDTDNERVRVMYTQPRHVSMQICAYFLEGRCRHSAEECHLSHGQLVHIDELREFNETDNSSLSIGDACLAKFTHDDLWYKATIVDSHGEDFLQVMFDDYGETTHAVERCDVIPLDSQSDDSSSSSEDDAYPGEVTADQDDGDDIPNYLWKPSDKEQLAEWENHTRGVGSRLMAAMGYRAGQGLGKACQGRVEPVPILKLPPGKSLDRIMQLKERTGNKDMFDVMKRKKHHHKSKLPQATSQRPKKSADMFVYLNKSLGHGKRVDLTSYRKQSKDESVAPSVISKHQLMKKSDKSINIQVIKTEEEIFKVRKEILSIKQRLEVNVSRRDSGGVRHLTEKLRKAERYLETLTHSHRELSRHRGQREGRKKLTVF